MFSWLKPKKKKKNLTENFFLFFILFFLTAFLKNCLFRCVKLAKNADPDKYEYSGYGTVFDSHFEFSLPNASVSKNVIIFGVDMKLSVHIDNKGKDILILGKDPMQEYRWYYVNSKSSIFNWFFKIK